MKLFTQLALVTAIATSGSAFAMQAMDDSALSSTTGQDGITLIIVPPTLGAALATGQTHGLQIGAAVLHDKDGISGANSGGAIILGDAHQAAAAGNSNAVGTQLGVFGSTPIVVTIDASGGGAAGAVSGSAPVLNVNVSLPADLLIRTGTISIDGSNRGAIAVGAAGATVANAATGGTTGNAIKILDSIDIGLGGATLNIQLGNTPQGAMIVAGGSVAGGLSISNLSLHDANAALTTFGGDLGVGVITIKDAGGANLTINSNIDVVNDVSAFLGGAVTGRGGLVITSGGVVGNDIMMQNVTLGSATSRLGDLQLINVQTVGTVIAVTGH